MLITQNKIRFDNQRKHSSKTHQLTNQIITLINQNQINTIKSIKNQ
jgi:hypothetical protein